ncbi:MAG: spermidine synthase, partial [Acidiferrobacterales bacterium]
LLLGYALAEGLIGVSGLLFHDAFVRVTEVAYNVILPSLGSTALVHWFKWVVSALLILPQSILLGMTFPLMSAGIIRWFPKSPGASLAILYFTNSLGAAVGVLISGFVLIRLVGLPGTIMTAGLINVFLAIAVWLLAKGSPAPGKLEGRKAPDAGNGRWYATLLGVSLLTGTASFIYEIGWIRMLSLVLGSSTHAFELMLSAFIFGLALGGLWIRRRIDRIDNIIRFIALVQLTMGLLALLTLLVYGHTFEFMQWTIRVLSKTDAAYTVFNLSSHLIGLAVMLPATFCAGITLPLITYALIQQKHGEKSIGAVYASNTVGAIVGVIFAVHVGMTVFGLKGLISLGASVDIALGLFLLWRLRESEGTRTLTISTAIGIAGVVAALLWVDFDAYKMASGVYRSGHLLSPKSVEILYHEDGKTATIDLVAEEHAVQVRTNGKTEARVAISENFPAAADEPTMILAGAIPLAIHPGAKKVANIGIGSGLTTHTLLAAPWLETVDTIEIEPAMVEAARGFGPRVEATFTDPRSHIYIEDAKTYFSTQNKKYDIIVSEPSNPWVSGTASLFSEEFYRLITRHLNKDGILVQWLQLYEIDLKLVASVFKSLSPHFSHYAVYGATNSDILIVAKHKGKITRPDIRVFQNLGLKGALERIGVRGVSDIELRNIGSKDVLDPLFASFSIPHNSDYFPVLDLNAAKSRFLGAHALDLIGLGHVGVPAVEMLSTKVGTFRATDISASTLFYRAQTARNAIAMR